MALEPGAGLQSISPTSSGRASPISRKWGSRRGEDNDLLKDKTFRRYASGVDRSLSLFDTALQEWADYISFLGRLLKSLQAHPSSIAVIPSKSIVAKRLAQCLNPTLPSGVHQKALEVYSYIFTMVGKEVLSKDLPLYLPGLSSTLSFASLSVRSPFLALFETHLLKLDPIALRPALKALILTLLPGLEEETSEDFERTLNLLNGFRGAVRSSGRDTFEQKQSSGDEYFWQCFFLASITSNNRRLGALAYLSRNLPKLGSPIHRGIVSLNFHDNSAAVADQISSSVTSPEPGLLVRCFAAGLNDDQILIQRGYLDLLVTHLPLHATVLQKRVKKEDLELLLLAASGVVLRRDMSLNRRLWTWFLGPEPSMVNETDTGVESPSSPGADPMNSAAASRTRYFEEYGLSHLTQALLKTIQRNTSLPGERAKPFRICLSLMDRWEIGGLVVPEIFLPVVTSVRLYQSQSTKSDFQEVLRSASVFFDGVESGLIWGEILSLITDALGNDAVLLASERSDKLSLVKFIIANFNVREEEMLMIHAPLAALSILALVGDFALHQSSKSGHSSGQEVSALAVGIAVDLMDLIPERAFSPKSTTNDTDAEQYVSAPGEKETSHVLQSIWTFYEQDQGNLDISPPPLSTLEVCELLHRESGKVIGQSLDTSISSADITIKTRLMVMLLNKSPKASSLDVDNILKAMNEKLATPTQLPFFIFTSMVTLLTALHPRYVTVKQFSALVDPMVRLAWSYLSASNPKYHVESVRGLWQLQAALSLSNHEIEASICNIMMEHDVSGTYSSRDADPGRSFSILWTHTLQDNAGHLDRRASRQHGERKGSVISSVIGNYEVMLGRPLFIFLDALIDEKTQLFVTVRTWLQSLVGVDKLFHIFVAKFAGFGFLQTAEEKNAETADSTVSTIYSEDDDLDQCLYYLQRLSNILRWSSEATWSALVSNTISTDSTHRALHLITRQDSEISLQEFFVHVCLRAITGGYDPQNAQLKPRIGQLHRTALLVLHQILVNPFASPLAELDLEDQLIARLQASLRSPDPFIQVSLLDVVFAVLKLKIPMHSRPPLSPPLEYKRPLANENHRTSSLSLNLEQTTSSVSPYPAPPMSLVRCLEAGLAAPSSRAVLDSWITFLSECLPYYSASIFQVLIPLVETFCTQIALTFGSLQKTFQYPGLGTDDVSAPESTLISLINGLEQVLACGHERLLRDEARSPALKSPEQPQGFFGNMVSGVFSSDTPQTRSQNANNRLTVLLTFQDAVRMCFTIWSWGGRGLEGSSQDSESVASFSYTSLRMRNRARRLLEHLFAAETLECLETVIEIWQKAATNIADTKNTAVLNLLHVLDGSRPKHTIPAIFDAIYSRTNPNALDPSRKSTLTSTLLDTELVVFLVEYARSLEDDAMDEIWTDCITFLKEILGNPFPHRQTLPSLLEFAAILGEKVDNTNFGEQKRMRRELGDIFLRLLTATFTTKPLGYSESANLLEKQTEGEDTVSTRQSVRSDDVVSILAAISPNLPKILVEPDRVLSAANTISASVIGPTIRSKTYPDNVTKSTLVLLYQLARLPNTQKSWKKDLSDAFNDPRFFANSLSLVESDWLPLLRQWALSDKERMPDLLNRLAPPTTAGIVFGVGATSARLEADRKTQLNLRRIATLVMAAADDTFVADLIGIEEKLVELLSASTTSSPSSTTRAEIYMVLRALALKTSPIHLAFLWPTINAELYTAISSVVAPDHSQSSDTYNNFSILQACKLLDTLLCIAPDDFQLHEWLFITDTIDAVYRPSNFHPVGLIDELSEELGMTAIASASYAEQISGPGNNTDKSVRKPLLGPGGVDCENVSLERKDELVGKVLRPFFSQLSIFAFERTYEMGSTDTEACRKSLLVDLFDERGIVKAL